MDSPYGVCMLYVLERGWGGLPIFVYLMFQPLLEFNYNTKILFTPCDINSQGVESCASGRCSSYTGKEPLVASSCQ